MFQGKEYDAVRITFAKGTGDTPDDYYVAYIDRATAHLKMVYYVVTYPAMRKGRPVSQLEPHAIVFEDWQTVDGLLVPKTAPFYKWTGSDDRRRTARPARILQCAFPDAAAGSREIPRSRRMPSSRR